MNGRIEVAAVTFDVTGTLLTSPRLGEIYAEVLGRHGIAVESTDVQRLVPVVWQELACLARRGHDRFTDHPEGARGWWHRFVERLCEHLETPPPSRFATAELYHRFARAEAWEIYPEVPATLATLRQRGLALGVVSNWDERLGPLLDELGLGRWLDVVVTSAAAGVEKPDPRIFFHALERLGVAPHSAVHVGDSRKDDVEGALAAGMRALHLVRKGVRKGVRGGDGDLGSLAPLDALLAAPASRGRLR